jgi:O-antigen ligase
MNNPIFGGLNSYYKILEISPHNILLNAWIRGGLIGFIAIITMITIIFKKSFSILKKKNIENPVNIYITLALGNIILLSFAHNEGITSAHGFNFILITLFVMINYRSKIHNDFFKK